MIAKKGVVQKKMNKNTENLLTDTENIKNRVGQLGIFGNYSTFSECVFGKRALTIDKTYN